MSKSTGTSRSSNTRPHISSSLQFLRVWVIPVSECLASCDGWRRPYPAGPLPSLFTKKRDATWWSVVTLHCSTVCGDPKFQCLLGGVGGGPPAERSLFLIQPKEMEGHLNPITGRLTLNLAYFHRLVNVQAQGLCSAPLAHIRVFCCNDTDSAGFIQFNQRANLVWCDVPHACWAVACKEKLQLHWCACNDDILCNGKRKATGGVSVSGMDGTVAAERLQSIT
jgi:hypothetical protein